MKQNIFKKTVLIPMISSIFTSTLLFADIEPNSSCDQSETVAALDGVTNSIQYLVNGAIVGQKRPIGEAKPPYERDYYNFRVESDGEITISYLSSQKAYFRVGTKGCNSTNIASGFGKPVTKTFKVKKGQRVDFMTHCRYSNRYTIDVNFKSDASDDSLVVTPIKIKPIIKKDDPSEDKSLSDENLTFNVVFPSNTKPLKAEYRNGLLTIDMGDSSEPISIIYDGKEIVENSNDFSFDFTTLDQKEKEEIKEPKESKNSDILDVEPNSICSQSELIEALDNVNGSVHYKNSGKIRVNEDGDIDHQGKAHDYYHFTPNMDGKLVVKSDSNRKIWFAMSNNGCHSAWSREWNLQRGSTSKLNKSIDVKQDQEINLLLMSYSKRDYELDIEFIPNH
jgi:hypothetical protein